MLPEFPLKLPNVCAFAVTDTTAPEFRCIQKKFIDNFPLRDPPLVFRSDTLRLIWLMCHQLPSLYILFQKLYS